MTFYDTAVAALSPTRVGTLTDADPGPFAVLRHVICTTRAQHDAAVAAIAPGDWIDVKGVTLTGEVVYTKQLASPAKLTFDAASSFTGTASGSRLPAIWLNQCTNLQFYFGGVCPITNIGGVGILAYGAQQLVLDGFVVHDTGGTGVFLTSISRDMHHFFVRGEIYHCGLDLAQDPHAEKGTGQHAINVADGNANHVFHGTIAVYGHDMNVGTVSEFGDPSLPPYDLDIFLKGLNYTQDATSQVSANVVNLWGVSGMHDLRFHVVEGTNMHGRAVDSQGMSGGATLVNVVVAYGRANQCCLNPSLGSTEPAINPTNPWDPRFGIIYQDVQTNTGNGGGGGGGGTLIPGTFGRESIGTSWASLQADNFSGSLFQAPADVGAATKITAYLRGGPTSQVVRAVIFTASASGPVGGTDTPLAATAQVTIAANQLAGWVDLPFPTPPNLTPGAWYVLELWPGATDSSAQFAYDTSGALNYWAGAVPYVSTGLPPSPYPSSATGTAPQGISIYATYGASVPVDTTPPKFLSGQVAARVVTLRFDEALDPGSVPVGSEFAVVVNGSGVASPAVAISGYNVLLTLAAAVGATDVVTVAYTAGSPPLQDVAGNDVVGWTATSVQNVTARVVGGSGRLTSISRTINPAGRIAGRGGGGI